MFKCVFCGFDNPSEKARFCVECGPDGPAKEWTTEDIDQPLEVTQYASVLGEFFFSAPSEAAVEKFSLRMRERLKISHETHSSVHAQLVTQKRTIAHLFNFRLEFDENVIDAYAGHDTFLNFRCTNLSGDDLFKVRLEWLDSDAKDSKHLRAQTSFFLTPQKAATLSASIIFERIGIKEIAGMQITIIDQFGESANFRAEPFSFKVASHDQRITQNISTHNQISIEGRGVVDATGMGADKNSTQPSAANQARWRELGFSYIPQNLPLPECAQKVSAEQTLQQESEPLGTTKLPTLEYDPNDLIAVQNAAEQGNPHAQTDLGVRYADGEGVEQDYEQAVYWYEKAAEQGDAGCQWALGSHYRLGVGVAYNPESAEYWLRKSAEQGNLLAVNELCDFYLDLSGAGVTQNDELALTWIEKAAELGHLNAQYHLGFMYQNGRGVAQNDQVAVQWFQKAAEQGHLDAQNNLGLMYRDGRGVAQNDE
jgi:TPR repeat protein